MVVEAPDGGRDAKMAAGAEISFPKCMGPGTWWIWRRSCSGRSRGWSGGEGGGYGMAVAAGACQTADEGWRNGGEVLANGRCGGGGGAVGTQRPQRRGVEREEEGLLRRWRRWDSRCAGGVSPPPLVRQRGVRLGLLRLSGDDLEGGEGTWR